MLFKRSISLPPRYPDTHFKLFRVCTGPTYERTTRTELWKRMKLVQDFPPNKNHWVELHEYLQHKPQHQTVRIGYAPRRKLYGVRKGTAVELPAVVSSTYLLYDYQCHCIPPCECQWSERHYNDPWTLGVLKDLQAISGLASELVDGDVIVAGARYAEGAQVDGDVMEGGEQKEVAGGELTNDCDCMVPHLCHWKTNKYAKAPGVLTVVRLYKDYVASGADDLAFDCGCGETKH